MACDRKRILRVFEGSGVDRVPWMPRIDHWYRVNRARGTLPPSLAGLDLPEVYLRLKACWRCYSSPYVKVYYEGDVEVEHLDYGDFKVTRYKTPAGTLEQVVNRRGEGGFSGRIVKYLVSGPEDFKPLLYLLENIRYEFDAEAYRELERYVGASGMLWYYFPRTPFQRLLINYIGVERTLVYLYRYRERIEELMEAIAQSDDGIYEAIGGSPLKILNFGDNIDARITSPRIFEKYCLPYYQERVDQLHRKDKFIHCHVDGYAKPLLHLFREAGWDGVEALTTSPVGDLTLTDIKEALGDNMVLIDGIPYIYFLPSMVSTDKFKEFVYEIIRLFGDRLILGISDELPPGGDIDRVRLVSEIVEETVVH